LPDEAPACFCCYFTGQAGNALWRNKALRPNKRRDYYVENQITFRAYCIALDPGNGRFLFRLTGAAGRQ
jgi:hypothetical protein